ncbi:MAG: hypothetical protein V3R83_12470 [Gammaproteobacteria bacterium]
MTSPTGTPPKKHLTMADVLADILLHAEITHYDYPAEGKKSPWRASVSFKMNGKVRTIAVRGRLKRHLIPALAFQINHRLAQIQNRFRTDSPTNKELKS